MDIEEARRIVDERIAKRLLENPEGAKGIGKAVALEITGEFRGRWLVDCVSSPAKVVESDDGSAETTISLDSGALEKIISGELTPPAAFMSGQIRVDGDLGAAVRLGQLLM